MVLWWILPFCVERFGQLTMILWHNQNYCCDWLAGEETFLCVPYESLIRNKEDNGRNRLYEGGQVDTTPNPKSLNTDALPYALLLHTNCELVSQGLHISELLQQAKWVPLSAQFVRQTAGLCKCCPGAAVGLHCPHPSLFRLSSSSWSWNCFIWPLLVAGPSCTQ